jgi:hypothetical protein
MTTPSTCGSNDDCPVGLICSNGSCVPQGNTPGGCANASQCPTGQICVAGNCVAQQVCNIPHQPNRLQGQWKFDSQLHIRDGLEGLTDGVLSVATSLQEMITGKFKISGVPGFISDLVSSAVKSLVKEYVPKWGQQVIQWLANVDDAIDDTRVLSTETFTAIGQDQYVGSSTWTLVEFEFQGAKVSSAPESIPGLGKVTTENYTAREMCGVLVMDKHKVKNSVGLLYRWAIEAVLTAVSCSVSDVPCYTDLKKMLGDLIDCPAIGSAVESSIGYGTGSLVEAACKANKDKLVKKLLEELDSLATKMEYMSLGAKADIANESQLANGRWFGVLGGAFGSGNFEGTFSAQK